MLKQLLPLPMVHPAGHSGARPQRIHHHLPHWREGAPHALVGAGRAHTQPVAMGGLRGSDGDGDGDAMLEAARRGAVQRLSSGSCAQGSCTGHELPRAYRGQANIQYDCGLHAHVRRWDLCAGPHVERTSDINMDAVALESVAGGA